MSCTSHFLNFHWTHHSWRRRVTAADNVPTQATNMWGRVVNSDYVRCRKEEVCEACGTVRRDRDCLCDTAQGERCEIRRAWIDESHQATK